MTDDPQIPSRRRSAGGVEMVRRFRAERLARLAERRAAAGLPPLPAAALPPAAPAAAPAAAVAETGPVDGPVAGAVVPPFLPDVPPAAVPEPVLVAEPPIPPHPVPVDVQPVPEPAPVPEPPAAEPPAPPAPPQPAREAVSSIFSSLLCTTGAAATVEVENRTEAAAGRPLLGLGPGMRMRLQQLGYNSLEDLAHADPGRLRQALGEISRLIDIDGWIARARRLRG
ncbi:hypothetical protein NON00_08545 [Roseomonas sp. GC11]|uniref:hypothetical protein n=1 Tax=Roseomonas sp. GC11 TaxID=2950546 RepID=UPI00210A94D9|nr:hypothetical protein [Roseomonas sp. GC11]MCQ4159978.1 hypothetical protein [Roseomonas sp. GC11]